MSIEAGECERERVFRALLGSARCPEESDGISDATYADLDWPYVMARVARHCRSADAAELATALGVLSDLRALDRRWAEGREALRLVESAEMAPMPALDSIGAMLRAARRGQVLDGLQLLAVARSADAAQRAGVWWRARSAKAPLLAEHADELVDLAEIRTRILPVLADTGELLDEASPELKSLRARVRSIRESLQRRLDGFLKSPRYEGILQDDYVTLRDGRYVLPVRAGEKGDFPGIVHGHSGSGATLFIEPAELIDANNDLRVAQLAVESEEIRIRSEFTELIAEHGDDVERNQDILTFLDLSWAIACFGEELGACHPELLYPDTLKAESRGGLVWREARHPVLAIRGLLDEGRGDLVPNTISLEAASRFLIVSGPNAGGKTVALKTVGLLALMTRAGLPIPVHPDSRVPVFERVFTVIGDHQTVERDLSTFSGHVASIAAFLHRCDPQSLILLDELFAGTDPEQGAALGRALLESLVRRGCWGVATTHLEALKTLAFQDDRFTCASVGFDMDKLRPTYQLRQGVPGASYALRIAGRLGLPAEIVARAENIMSGSAHAAGEEVIARMESELASLRSELEEASDVRRRLEARERDLEQREKDVRDQKRTLARKGADALGGELDVLRERIRVLARQVEEAALPSTEQERAAARKQIEEARAAARASEERLKALRNPTPEPDPTSDILSHAALQAGMRVWVRSFDREGRVVEVPQAGAKIPVQLGPIRASVDLAQLAPMPAGPSARKHEAPRPTAFRSPAPPTRELDLRGARVEDAIERLEAEAERWLLHADGTSMRIIHGHGTGALRRAVREFLSGLPENATWRPGERNEGGDGVTFLEPEGIEGGEQDGEH